MLSLPFDVALSLPFETPLSLDDRAVMISNQPRPTTVSRELRDYYLRQENGRELLLGVKVVPNTEEAVDAGAAGHEEVNVLLLWPSCTGVLLACRGFHARATTDVFC